jgi:hypothetical protein
MKSSPCAVDLYVRVTHPNIVFYRQHRTWDAGRMLDRLKKYYPNAQVEVIDRSTYLRGIKHATAAN